MEVIYTVLERSSSKTLIWIRFAKWNLDFVPNNAVWGQVKPLAHYQNSFPISIHSLMETLPKAGPRDFVTSTVSPSPFPIYMPHTSPFFILGGSRNCSFHISCFVRMFLIFRHLTSVCIHLSVSLCACVYMCICACVYECMCMYAYRSLCACMHACICMMCKYMHRCVYVCICVHVCVCTCVCCRGTVLLWGRSYVLLSLKD